MNIFLVPYTWARHVSVALVVGAMAVLTWWCFLMLEAVVLPSMGLLIVRSWEGALLLALSAGVIGGTSIFAEGSLRRRSLAGRVLGALGAAVIAFMAAMVAYGFIQLVTGFLVSKEAQSLVRDPSFASLRYRFLQWTLAGFASGFGPLIVRLVTTRKLSGILEHLAGGIAAGALGGAVWHLFGYYRVPLLGISPDLYIAPAVGLFTWGALHGLLVWGVPSELYAGWVRVLSRHRFGHRIPIDRVDGSPAERFVGHFPRGLDMYLPAEAGVAELHVSFVSDGKQGYAVRGLSQHPIQLKRFLEKVDLRYDQRRPAPLETELQMEDRLTLGAGDAQTEFEFLLLPKEER